MSKELKWTEIYPKISGRVEAIKHYTVHCDVLDVGSDDMDGKSSLSKEIEKTAKSVTRIDIQKGQNFETYRAGRKFDCIVAGEVIEHLDNVGLFLDNCHRHLADRGRLVITTPNPHSLERMLHHIIFSKFKADASDNPAEHTCMFTFELLERMLKRHGFAIEKKLFVNHEAYSKSRISRFRNTLFLLAKLDKNEVDVV